MELKLGFILKGLILTLVQVRADDAPSDSPRIIGGSDAAPGEIPFQVSLRLLSSAGVLKHDCGGVVLNDRTVLTAAHCIYNRAISRFEIVAGDHNIFEAEGTEQRRLVESAVWNPAYNPNTMDGDVGLIRVSVPFQFNEYVSAIPLARPSAEPSGVCVSSGWGNVLNNGSSQTPQALQKIDLDIVSRGACTEVFEPVGPIFKGNICAGGTDRGACNGDSGGPLICKDDGGQAYLAGSVSWGLVPCATYNAPTVYTSIGYYRDWIEETIYP